MTKDNTTTIDSDHEIEDFLQEFIVQKIISGNEESTTDIQNGINELRQEIHSIKNTSSTTSQDIAILRQNDREIVGNSDEISQNIKKVIKKIEAAIKTQSEIKKNIPNEERIIESLSNAWTNVIEEKIAVVQEDTTRCMEDLSGLSSATQTLTTKVEEIASIDQNIKGEVNVVYEELNSLKAVLQPQQACMDALTEEIKRMEESANKNREALIQNDNGILQEMRELNQKAKYIWLMIGVDTMLIVATFVVFLIK